MQHDQIKEIGIDDKGRLYVKPTLIKLPYIYREAMEVHWDKDGNFLYSPKPREWSYFDWFKQIISAAKEQSCLLTITEDTEWVNVQDNLKVKIQNEY